MLLDLYDFNEWKAIFRSGRRLVLPFYITFIARLLFIHSLFINNGADDLPGALWPIHQTKTPFFEAQPIQALRDYYYLHLELLYAIAIGERYVI